MLNFLDSKYKEEQSETNFNFTKYLSSGVSDDDSSNKKTKKRKNEIPTFVHDDDSDYELDPIRLTDDSSIFDDDTDGNAVKNMYNKTTLRNNNNNNEDSNGNK